MCVTKESQISSHFCVMLSGSNWSSTPRFNQYYRKEQVAKSHLTQSLKKSLQVMNVSQLLSPKCKWVIEIEAGHHNDRDSSHITSHKRLDDLDSFVGNTESLISSQPSTRPKQTPQNMGNE
ncbi:hypothetical protein Smp_178370 [Schistosoma mansoni]|uniref:hypothetical protein n=1 Tax=Schistosoma mansoni TaxID=6183 RepID=UPI00022DCA7E|nr:hypothetical protein Smp_178370 [Schistosoma mansoni]|eukprot:XP_018654934.1 hypothetical protein Smp_178370 [Schistosoma mansoni]